MFGLPTLICLLCQVHLLEIAVFSDLVGLFLFPFLLALVLDWG